MTIPSRYPENTMTRGWIGSCLMFAPLLPGCSWVQEWFSLIGPPAPPVSRMREPTIERLRPGLQASFDAKTRDAHAQIVDAHTTVENIPGRFKRRLAIQPLMQPWAGLSNLEAHGL